jgi:hypothetical protein
MIGEMCQDYPPGVPVTPPHGPAFAFYRPEDALDWFGNRLLKYENYSIWKCTGVEDPVQPEWILLFSRAICPENVEWFWNTLAMGGIVPDYAKIHAPLGIVFLTTITLVEEVDKAKLLQ